MVGKDRYSQKTNEELVHKLIQNEERYKEFKYSQTLAEISRLKGELIVRENARRRKEKLPLTWEDNLWNEKHFFDVIKTMIKIDELQLESSYCRLCGGKSSYIVDKPSGTFYYCEEHTPYKEEGEHEETIIVFVKKIP